MSKKKNYAGVPHAEIEARLGYWMRDGGYLPPAFRDFHAQKDLFKTIHDRVLVHKHDYCGDVSWVSGQCYVVDVFLWFMARHGYTLQRSRRSVPHFDLEAKQARFAEQPQSAEEREAYHAVNEASNELMWGKHPEPSKAILTDERAMECARAMYSGDGDKMDAYAQGMRDARDIGYLSASKAILLPMGEPVAWMSEYGEFVNAATVDIWKEDGGPTAQFFIPRYPVPLFANTKAVSLVAIKKEVYQWRARHFNNPKEQADDLDSRLNNLTK